MARGASLQRQGPRCGLARPWPGADVSPAPVTGSTGLRLAIHAPCQYGPRHHPARTEASMPGRWNKTTDKPTEQTYECDPYSTSIVGPTASDRIDDGEAAKQLQD